MRQFNATFVAGRLNTVSSKMVCRESGTRNSVHPAAAVQWSLDSRRTGLENHQILSAAELAGGGRSV